VSFLELERLEKTYPDGTRAVRSIDLSVERGEFVVLLGPSGCGKTTTLRMIAGLERPTGGAIRLDGREVTRLRPALRDVGFVFQFYALYPHLTAFENIAFPLRCAGHAPAKRTAAVRRVAERLGIVGLLAALPRELSGGEQQRVALARAMVRTPAVYLMDEPLGTLDADQRLELCELVRAQQLELGVTAVYVTHDQEEAMRLADRILVMSEGRILQHGTPLAVYDRPADLFVAHFVGSPGMNFVEGEVRADGTQAAFQPRGAGACIPLAGPARAGRATLGFRPEHARLDARGSVRGRVAFTELLGPSSCVHVDTGFGRVVARAAPDVACARGEEVGLALDAAHLCLFDPDSGRRLA
jgi:multiple sugar transport system ATP-binding protein